jgi:hypothetical protein
MDFGIATSFFRSGSAVSYQPSHPPVELATDGSRLKARLYLTI